MPRFRFVGTEPRVFPGDGTHPSVEIEPGAEVDLPDNPDPHFFEPADSTAEDTPISAVSEQEQ